MTAVRQARPLPEAQQRTLARAQRVCVWSIVLQTGVVALMFAVMGGSHAMRTALVEDVLSLVPPIAFLIAARFAHRDPDTKYPNGRWRAFDLTFMVASVALTCVGIALVYDSGTALLGQEHPTIGTVQWHGRTLWLGWLMMAALLISSIPPVVLGRMKSKLAAELHLKSLQTDADTSKADWMTALAGIVGITGLGFGWWWADAAAALFIAVSVLKDGLGNLLHATRDVLDSRPETTQRERADPIVGRIRTAVGELGWVEHCDPRLHEEGMRISGVVLVAPREGELSIARLREVRRTAQSVHWRVDDIVATAYPDEGAESG